MRNITIKKCSKSVSNDIIKLTNEIFNNQTINDKIVVYIVCKFKNNIITKFIYKKLGYKSLEFWYASDEKSNVLGIIALYNLLTDSNNYTWIGWFGTDKNCRNCGIGSMLIDYIEKEVKNRGKKIIKLYSYDIPERKNAMKLYEKRNYKITSIEKDNNYDLIHRELHL